LLVALFIVFGAQKAVMALISQPVVLPPSRGRHTLMTCNAGGLHRTSPIRVWMPHRERLGKPWACESLAGTTLSDVKSSSKSSKRARFTGHLAAGPVSLSWASAALTMALQVKFTEWTQLDQDAATLAHYLGSLFPGDLLALGDPAVQRLTLYASLWAFSVANAFFVITATFPAPEAKVPFRRQNMRQHELIGIDYSYMLLNTLCMPGLFYHFLCLMRSWGLDLASPPLFGIYPPDASQLFLETLPVAAGTMALYFLAYEFFYYHWHRAMHEVPALYTWVHKHHHQQTYPDRPAIDTLNTACLESQVGLYMQLATLWSFDKLLGLHNLPAGIWFFTIAGWLSIVEHDSYERALPFDIFRADEHHMHHSFVRCNYSPYSTLWDRVFGTYKPFEVRRTVGADAPQPSVVARLGGKAEPMLAAIEARPSLPRPRAVAVEMCDSASPIKDVAVEMCDGASPKKDELFGKAGSRLQGPLVQDLQIFLGSADAAAGLLGVKLSDTNRVLKVAAGSPAAHAGLQALDVITEIDGTSCRSPTQLRELLSVETCQHQTRRFIRVLRPRALGSNGAHAPSSEVLDVLAKPAAKTSWGEAEASVAELSKHIWSQVERSKGSYHVTDSRSNEVGAVGASGPAYSGEVAVVGSDNSGVAHSEVEYLPASRGAAALILAAVQGVFFLVAMLPIFERSAA